MRNKKASPPPQCRGDAFCESPFAKQGGDGSSGIRDPREAAWRTAKTTMVKSPFGLFIGSPVNDIVNTNMAESTPMLP